MLSLPKQELKGHFTMLPMDEVHFGSGSLDNLSAELDKQGVSRAVIITGNTLAQNTELVEKVAAAAGNKCAGVFHETSQHVPRRTVIAAADYARERGADALISFGGGTPNDTAKAATICLAEGITEPSGLDAYMIKFTYPDQVEIPSLTNDPIPMFAIPTTLSAGEFTYFVGITDEDRKVKDLYVDRRITAKAVILDPDLTMETPERLWLGTGMRAVDHCIEAMCSSTAQPFIDALAYRALNMLVRYLRETKADPDDGGARAVHGGGLDVGLRACQRHAGVEPRHRPPVGRPLQRAPRRDLGGNDAARDGLQPRANHDPAGLGGRSHGRRHRRHERGGGRDRRGGRSGGAGARGYGPALAAPGCRRRARGFFRHRGRCA